MHSITNIIRTVSLVGAFALAVVTARAVSPPPDGGYPGFNTAEGDNALLSLTTGTSDTAIGYQTLLSNTTGINNTAVGDSALNSNTTGDFNTAEGSAALEFNTTGFDNTANGRTSLQANTGGSLNTGNGFQALLRNTTGNSNIAFGANAGSNLTTGSNNIDIGNVGIAGESAAIRIGTSGTQTATFIAGIREAALTQGVAVAVGVTADGQLGIRASSARFKEAIKPMEEKSEAILALEPVSFRYKKALDPKGTPQFGLVAEQVAKVDPDLVANDAEGKPYTVRYEEVNAMLLNEFLKAHRKLDEQAALITEVKSTAAKQDEIIDQLEAMVAEQQKKIGTLTSQIEKVSNQVELTQPGTRVVINR